jgi:hypothetical protein
LIEVERRCCVRRNTVTVDTLFISNNARLSFDRASEGSCALHTHLGQEEESDHENDHVHLLALLVQVFVQCVHFVEKEDDKTNEPLVKERQRKESE